MTDETLQASETSGTGSSTSTLPAYPDTNAGVLPFWILINCLCGSVGLSDMILKYTLFLVFVSISSMVCVS